MAINYRGLAAIVTTLILFASNSQAAISLGSPDDCDDGFQVVFDALNDVNPSYTVTGVPIYDTVTVSFGSRFEGQTLGSSDNSLDNTSPSNPLTLATDPIVKTSFDLANAMDIVLGGENFKTPIAILFDNPVSHVCFNLGHLDVDSPTLIETFTAAGDSLGAVNNLAPGTNRVSVTDSSGNNVISGISIYVPDGAMDWEGFGIHDLAFDVNVIPEPGTFVIWSLLGLVAFSAALWKRQ